MLLFIYALLHRIEFGSQHTHTYGGDELALAHQFQNTQTPRKHAIDSSVGPEWSSIARLFVNDWLRYWCVRRVSVSLAAKRNEQLFALRVCVCVSSARAHPTNSCCALDVCCVSISFSNRARQFGVCGRR